MYVYGIHNVSKEIEPPIKGPTKVRAVDPLHMKAVLGIITTS